MSKKNHQHSIFGSYDKGNGYRFNTGFENNKLLYQGNFQLDELNTIVSESIQTPKLTPYLEVLTSGQALTEQFNKLIAGNLNQSLVQRIHCFL